ncbi:hypothetical protein M427DRAFT_61620 [Gonapodya prolifera JEL478]|uniref:Uncharacterized protein n=1 Tax=Gonapodya prolifera (strain JEL478) TaxID=1344416 RepID=A0A139A1P4_GONPJ|nr:hypothetical protein M427DRAFT_61620 [Gonapodya prolifera JEL478]|eukprot:KXS10682.1 hypothetical protein M427DRAFT_61620 [Gonapodya prolifera JEL478]
MTGALKSNATSFGALIKQDQKVMDSLSTETDTNFTQLKKERDRLRQHAESFWSTAVMMWAMVWITILLFAFTFVVLRVVPG